ncbi:hypothetical protein ACL02U_11810 [Streptomyces sp. MS06]|uniref:hypothetical protein n=1 Tax=Streptomyces sp. MS06 TaxID=3385974 RepID=UPI0039A23BD3
MTSPTSDAPRARLKADLRDLTARQRAQAAVDRSVARLCWLLAHPEAVDDAPHATDGELAEQRHLLYDADPDAVTPAFPYPTTPKEA